MAEVAIARFARRNSVILTHHGVGGCTDSRVDPFFLRVPESSFRRQLELLLRAGFEFTTVAGIAASAGPEGPRAGLLALSFDDGMEDNLSVAAPILAEYGVPATVFVVSGLLGEPNPWMAPTAKARMLTGPEVRELAVQGIEIGAHTVTHPDLSMLDRAGCRAEMTESRDALEEVTGQAVTTFAYPFYRHGPQALAAAREAGFAAAVGGATVAAWERYAMPRAELTGRDTPAGFGLKVVGRYEQIFQSPPVRVARSSTRQLRHRVRRRVEARR